MLHCVLCSSSQRLMHVGVHAVAHTHKRARTPCIPDACLYASLMRRRRRRVVDPMAWLDTWVCASVRVYSTSTLQPQPQGAGVAPLTLDWEQYGASSVWTWGNGTRCVCFWGWVSWLGGEAGEWEVGEGVG